MYLKSFTEVHMKLMFWDKNYLIKIMLNLLFFFPWDVLVLTDAIFFDENEDLLKDPLTQMWYQDKVLNILFREQMELLQ